MSNLKIIALLLLTIVTKNHPVEAYSFFQTYIPNGNVVPNPCDLNMMWPGVGHQSPAGGDARNPFGLDFKNNSFNWAAVCQLDSDGDGRTNGVELGDPGCTWTQGKPSPNTSVITHPGICEPLDDGNCTSRNSWLTCPEPFDCPAIHQPGVINMTLALPPSTPVPANETTYLCYGFIFSNDTDYHVIATSPIVSNPVVDHHYLLYVCKNRPSVDYFTEPVRCGMAPVDCISIIAVWSPGISGQCLTDEYGFHIGRDGYRYGILQVHLNNPMHITGMTDSSGFVFYYTSTMRPNDGTVMLVGQEGLAIPPGQPLVTYSGGCSGGCTSAALNHPINLTTAMLHMHLMGSSGHFVLVRNGSTEVLINQTTYDYNAPIMVSFDPPYTLHPGDQLYTTCNYDSRGTNKTTYWGEATNDEMCYVFLTYYPTVEVLPMCTQWRGLDQCLSGALFGCNTSTFFALAPTVASQNCTETECPPSCLAVMQEIVATGCMEGDKGDYMSMVVGYDNLPPLLDLCGLKETATTTTTTSAPTTRPLNSTSRLFSSFMVIASAIIATFGISIGQQYKFSLPC